MKVLVDVTHTVVTLTTRRLEFIRPWYMGYKLSSS